MNDRLHELLDRYADGRITDAEFAELRAMIADDPEAARAFARAAALGSLLTDRLAPEGQGTGVRVQGTEADHRTSHIAHRPSRLRYALAASLLLSAAAVIVYVFAVARPPSPVPSVSAPIATLIETDADVVIDDRLGRPGSEYAAGSYSIASGSAEFLLTNRVGVRLSGDTSITMHSNMIATLARGTAEFNCPPGAEGYTVRLPDGAKVVDLGTRFKITIDPDTGRSDVRVTEGSVVLTARDADDALRRVELARGRIATLDRGVIVDVSESQLGDAWLAAFDVNASKDPAAIAEFFTPISSNSGTAVATSRGITLRYESTHSGGTPGNPLRDRGPNGPLDDEPMGPVLRDFVFADTLRNSHLEVELSGLEPLAAYRLRWFHYHASRDSSEFDRIAVYRTSADPQNLLFESASYARTDPETTGHTDFDVTADEEGRIRLVTGPHSGGRSIQMLNGLAVMHRIEQDAQEKPKTQETTHED